MSSGQILDKISHIFQVFKYFQVFLCVLVFFETGPDRIRTKLDPKPDRIQPTNSNFPIGSNYLRSEPISDPTGPNRTQTYKF